MMQDDLASELKETAARLLASKAKPDAHRALLRERGRFDEALWQEVASLGWPALTIPEVNGGLGLGIEVQAALAEECGRAVANIPLLVSSGSVVEALCRWGSRPQRDRWLPVLADGSRIGTFAYVGRHVHGLPDQAQVVLSGGQLHGTCVTVPFGAVADVAIVAVTTGSRQLLALADLKQAEVTRSVPNTIDNSRAFATLHFDGTTAEPLEKSEPLALISHLALITAFEQIGGATACLEAAVTHAKTRYAFGQPIGRFQAIKHKLVDMYTRIEIARGAALRAVAAPGSIARAAAARIGASEAYDFAAREAIQVHGGIGVMWEMNAHLHYRRARALALEWGAPLWWREQLVDALLDNEAIADGVAA